jgi:hypothetical protein
MPGVFGKYVRSSPQVGQTTHSSSWSVNNILKNEALSLITELWQIHALVKDIGEEEILQSSSAELLAVFKKLDELAALEVDEESTEVILKSPGVDYLLISISNFRFLYNLKLEIEKAKSLLESRNPWKTLKNKRASLSREVISKLGLSEDSGWQHSLRTTCRI